MSAWIYSSGLELLARVEVLLARILWKNEIDIRTKELAGNLAEKKGNMTKGENLF